MKSLSLKNFTGEIHFSINQGGEIEIGIIKSGLEKKPSAVDKVSLRDKIIKKISDGPVLLSVLENRLKSKSATKENIRMELEKMASCNEIQVTNWETKNGYSPSMVSLVGK